MKINTGLELFLKYLPKMHIHPSSPNSSLSEDDAAVKIQSNWKGYRVRKQLKNSRKMRNGQQNGHSDPMDHRALQEKSAAKIQANWKGYRVRKEFKKKINKDNKTCNSQ